jgi:predicted Zn-dependent protease
MKFILKYSLLALITIVFTTCSRNPVSGKKELTLMSESQELAMGQEADPQIQAEFGVYPDSSIQHYVNNLGQKLAKVSHRANIPYTFRVIDSDVINAFAVPGGFIYITRGILAYLNDEAQLAGVIGHEIGHIAARHSVKQQRNAMLGQLGIIAGDPGNRNTHVQQLADEYQKKYNITNPVLNRNSYLQKIDGIVYGEDPRGGYMDDGVFYHPEIKFQFTPPTGWQYHNSPTRVQYAPKDGSALFYLGSAQGNTLQEAANAFIQNNKLTAEQTAQVTINGLPAYAIVFSQMQQQQDGTSALALRGLSYVVQYNKSLFQMVGVTSPNAFNQLAPTFEKSMKSFKQLSDASKINKKPERVRIKTVKTTTSFEQVLKSFNVAAARYNEHAILNAVELNTSIPSGTLIKIIQ